MDPDLRSFLRAIGKRVSGGGVIDIGNAFVGMSQTVFIDWMHTAENGNERIAREIYGHLEPKLHQSTSRDCSGDCASKEWDTIAKASIESAETITARHNR